MSTILSPHKQTVRTFIDHLNAKEYTAILLLLNDDFTHTLLPASLGAPVRNKTKLPSLFQDIDNLVINLNITFNSEPLQDGNTVVAHTSANGKTVSGNPYTNEYIMMFGLSEDGQKITWMKEFFDTKYFADALAAEAVAAKTSGETTQ